MHSGRIRTRQVRNFYKRRFTWRIMGPETSQNNFGSLVIFSSCSGQTQSVKDSNLRNSGPKKKFQHFFLVSLSFHLIKTNLSNSVTLLRFLQPLLKQINHDHYCIIRTGKSTISYNYNVFLIL